MHLRVSKSGAATHFSLVDSLPPVKLQPCNFEPPITARFAAFDLEENTFLLSESSLHGLIRGSGIARYLLFASPKHREFVRVLTQFMEYLPSIIWYALLGTAAGWIANKALGTTGSHWLYNMAIGIVGAIVGGMIFNIIGFVWHTLIWSLCTAVVGAIVFLLGARYLKQRF